jgi:tRNA C32,U32 (ribose-2'-O)-methylase TrmJ
MPQDANTDIQHPDLAAALSQLADSLDRRHDDAAGAPSYLEMAALADTISEQLHDLAKMLVTAARAREGSSWTDVGHAFGVTRQAAMRRWT